MSSDEIKLILEKLNAMESRQRNIETGIINLGTRLEALENKVDERLQDTRPLWEGVQTQISELREEMARGFRGVERKFEVLSKQFLDSQAEQRDLIYDVEDLKKKVS